MAKATIRISEEALRLAETVQENVVKKIAPKAFKRIDAIVEPAIYRRLPDGDLPNPNDKDGTPSRMKQTAAVRAQFSGKMKRAIGGKTIRDTQGALRLIGVTNDAPHVNFDHGYKAKNQDGRVHKYWWRPGHEKPNPPKLRKQNVDIAAEAYYETKDEIEAIVVDELKKAVSNGDLIK